MVTGVAMLFRALASIALVALLLIGKPAAAQPAPPPDWGLLAEMAGKDYEGEGFFVTMRWADPGKRLQMDRWSGDWSGNFKFRWEFALDPETGGINFFPEGQKAKGWHIRAGSEGSIGIGDRSGKYEPWLSRGEDGEIKWGKKKLTPLDPAGKQGRRLAKLIAQGRVVPNGTLGSAPFRVAAPVASGAAANASIIAAPASATIAAEAHKGKWGALAQLAGKNWYCVSSNSAQWLARKRIESGYGFSYNRSPPVIRLTTAAWLEPYSLLKITTSLGDGRGWVDTIRLEPNGSFLMETEGVQAFARLRGRSDGWTVTFPLGKYGTNQNKLTFGGDMFTPVYELASGTFGDDARCFMQTIDSPESAERFKQTFLRALKDFNEKSSRIPSIQADMDADNARNQQMRANMQASLIGTIASGGGGGPVAYFPNTSFISGTTGSSFYEQLTAMADQAQGQAERSRRQLEKTIANAGAQNAGQNGSSANGSHNRGVSPNGSGARSTSETAMTGSSAELGSTRKSVPVYFVVGMRPTERNTRNPMCYSTVFNIEVALDPNGWGNQGRVNSALAPHQGSFLTKCSRHGQVDGTVNSGAQGISSGFPRPTPHNEDYEVTMP